MLTLLITKIQMSPKAIYRYTLKDSDNNIIRNVTDMTIRIDPANTDCPEICYNQNGEEWIDRVVIVQSFRATKSVPFRLQKTNLVEILDTKNSPKIFE